MPLNPIALSVRWSRFARGVRARLVFWGAPGPPDSPDSADRHRSISPVTPAFLYAQWSTATGWRHCLVLHRSWVVQAHRQTHSFPAALDPPSLMAACPLGSVMGLRHVLRDTKTPSQPAARTSCAGGRRGMGGAKYHSWLECCRNFARNAPIRRRDSQVLYLGLGVNPAPSGLTSHAD